MITSQIDSKTSYYSDNPRPFASLIAVDGACEFFSTKTGTPRIKAEAAEEIKVLFRKNASPIHPVLAFYSSRARLSL
ncbi:MAG: hypothetical protein ED859_14200 [Desulfuromonadales bacterium]|nr:MAG: hypothetical protein ED859_14200 [Desulfuromonadales bacterium]